MARKTKRVTYKKIVGARLLSANGGLIYCDNCEKIVGSMNALGYNLMMLVFCCTCGIYGSIEISRTKARYRPELRANRMPVVKGRACCCAGCDEPLFAVMEDRVQTYSFFVECKCGAQYDVKPSFNKRLGETLQMFKRSKDKR